MKKATKKKYIDLAGRAAWTFAQAFAAVIAITDAPFSKVTLVAAFAAGLSALKTFVKNTL